MMRGADFDSLWKYDDPAGTEAAFRAARPVIAQADNDGLVLELDTQIARAQALQGRFDEALNTLTAVRASLRPDQARARVRCELETGRVLRSSRKAAEARPHFELAVQSAEAAGEDALGVDARHMVALVEPDPALQVALNLDAVRIAAASADPKARRWQASLWNNIGMSHHAAGDLGAALDAFQRALALREQEGDAALTLIARWMVAWTWRLQGRLAEALAEQEALQREHAAAGRSSGYVWEELGELHLAVSAGDEAPARACMAAAYEAMKDDWAGSERLARIKAIADGSRD